MTLYIHFYWNFVPTLLLLQLITLETPAHHVPTYHIQCCASMPSLWCLFYLKLLFHFQPLTGLATLKGKDEDSTNRSSWKDHTIL